MKIVPVIDLLGGQVVRGIAGRRQEYRPVESMLAADAAPASIGAAFARMGFATAYVADLDAIGGAEPAWSTYRSLIECGLKLWIDAGLADTGRARAMAEFIEAQPEVTGVIAGLESLRDLQSLVALLEMFGPERLIFSLDLKASQPLAVGPAWTDLTADEIAATATDPGIRRLIVLDLAQVGTGEGLSTLDLCQRLRDRQPQLEITSGGGVRNLADLESLAAAGCDAALVASALHDGRISVKEVDVAVCRRDA
jgi:phosphoribosylformimino-5-aminoimidazole carboxamide ribotide isomerase